jgi:putative SOS response-associated peptidase YedK
MINACAETVATKPALRWPLRKHRCLIPADGFYVWQPVGRHNSTPWGSNPQRDDLNCTRHPSQVVDVRPESITPFNLG